MQTFSGPEKLDVKKLDKLLAKAPFRKSNPPSGTVSASSLYRARRDGEATWDIIEGIAKALQCDPSEFLLNASTPSKSATASPLVEMVINSNVSSSLIGRWYVYHFRNGGGKDELRSAILDVKQDYACSMRYFGDTHERLHGSVLKNNLLFNGSLQRDANGGFVITLASENVVGRTVLTGLVDFSGWRPHGPAIWVGIDYDGRPCCGEAMISQAQMEYDLAKGILAKIYSRWIVSHAETTLRGWWATGYEDLDFLEKKP